MDVNADWLRETKKRRNAKGDDDELMSNKRRTKGNIHSYYMHPFFTYPNRNVQPVIATTTPTNGQVNIPFTVSMHSEKEKWSTHTHSERNNIILFATYMSSSEATVRREKPKKKRKMGRERRDMVCRCRRRWWRGGDLGGGSVSDDDGNSCDVILYYWEKLGFPI